MKSSVEKEKAEFFCILYVFPAIYLDIVYLCLEKVSFVERKVRD